METYDVIIIGAGAAGLGAASSLAKQNKRVLVLEARDRIGGRILTRKNPPYHLPFEGGAEFVHGLSEEISIAAQSRGLTLVEVGKEQWEPTAKSFRRLDKKWEKINKVFSKLATPSARTADRSFDEFLKGYRRSFPKSVTRRAAMFVEGFHAADPKLISEQALQAAMESEAVGTSLRIIEGYENIPRYYFESAQKGGAECLLSQPVKRVQWKPAHVRVFTDTREFVGRTLLVTVPLNILKSKAITFEPSLPKIEKALENLEMGEVVRVSFRFRNNVWRKKLDNVSFLHTSHSEFPTWWTSRPIDAPIWVGWTGGPAAVPLAKLSDGDVIERALKSLSRALKIKEDKLKNELENSFFHNWQTDPFARGAYSYLKVGGIKSQKILAEPEASTIFFAGEALHLRRIGTVDGAIASGEHAAKLMGAVLD